jgi:hypothetical protein
MHHPNVEAWGCRGDPLRLLNHSRLAGRLERLTASLNVRLLTRIVVTNSWDHDKGSSPGVSLRGDKAPQAIELSTAPNCSAYWLSTSRELT